VAAQLAIALLALLLCSAARAGDIVALVQDGNGKPVEDAVIYVNEAAGNFHAPEKPVIMDQIDKEFVSRVLAVLVGTKVRFPNKDQIHHHVYSFSKAKKFEVPLYKGETADAVVMDKVGVVKLGCNIHDWMQGFIFVSDNPYFAKTGKDGRATIEGVPAGTYEVGVWSERLKGSPDATLQKASIGKQTAKLQFRPNLKPPVKSTRPAVSKY
jgi:plastocyanin